MARAVSIPRSPSPTFEQPELATTARSRSSAASLETITGAPSRALVVKRAADTVSGSSEATTPTSSPSRLDPGGHARRPEARRKQGAGRARPRARGRSTQRERKKVECSERPRVTRAPPPPACPSIRFRSCTAWPAAPFQRLSIAASAITRLVAHGRHMDPAAVGVAHVARAGRLVDERRRTARPRRPPGRDR